jgi:hypothetical protein
LSQVAPLQVFKLASQLRAAELSEPMIRAAPVERLLYDWLMLVLESHIHSQRYFGIYPTLGQGNEIADGSAEDKLEPASFRDRHVNEWSVGHVADFLDDLGLRSAAAAAEIAQVRFLRDVW